MGTVMGWQGCRGGRQGGQLCISREESHGGHGSGSSSGPSFCPSWETRKHPWFPGTLHSMNMMWSQKKAGSAGAVLEGAPPPILGWPRGPSGGTVTGSQRDVQMDQDRKRAREGRGQQRPFSF